MGPYDTRPWFYFLLEDAQLAEPYGEYITVCSDYLGDALTMLDQVMPKMNADAGLQKSLTAPYNYFYHHRTVMRAAAEGFSLAHQKVLGVLIDYFDVSQKSNFDEASEVFRRGNVNSKHFGKLFNAHDIVVRKEKDNGDLRAYQIESIDDAQVDQGALELHCWTWEFDGRFFKSYHDILVHGPSGEEISITELTVWPLRLDRPEVGDSLRQRGEMFWTLRHKKLVGYEAPALKDFEIRTVGPTQSMHYPVKC